MHAATWQRLSTLFIHPLAVRACPLYKLNAPCGTMHPPVSCLHAAPGPCRLLSLLSQPPERRLRPRWIASAGWARPQPAIAARPCSGLAEVAARRLRPALPPRWQRQARWQWHRCYWRPRLPCQPAGCSVQVSRIIVGTTLAVRSRPPLPGCREAHADAGTIRAIRIAGRTCGDCGATECSCGIACCGEGAAACVAARACCCCCPCCRPDPAPLPGSSA